MPVYPKFKEAALSGGVDLLSNTLKCVLIDSADYTYSAAHQYLSDVPAVARVGVPQTLGTKSVTNGVFDAANVTFPGVTGDPTEQALIYIYTGDESTSRLVVLTPVAAIPNGGDLTVQWDDGVNKIFAL